LPRRTTPLSSSLSGDRGRLVRLFFWILVLVLGQEDGQRFYILCGPAVTGIGGLSVRGSQRFGQLTRESPARWQPGGHIIAAN
jgi:hypothetical protein